MMNDDSAKAVTMKILCRVGGTKAGMPGAPARLSWRGGALGNRAHGGLL